LILTDRQEKKWEEFVKDETLFNNSNRLRYLIWTIQKYAVLESRVLEVGFGSGKTAFLMADMGYEVTAIDINDVLVSRLQNQYEKCLNINQLKYMQADMLSLPWDSQIFELAYSQGVLEHFSDKSILQALKEQGRVARMVIFDVPNSRYKIRPFGNERLLPVAHWRNLIRESGLEIVEELGRNFGNWHYLLPMAIFSKYGIMRLPWFSRIMGSVSIFVCRSSKNK